MDTVLLAKVMLKQDMMIVFGGNAVIKITKNISFALTDCQKTVGTITHAEGVSGEGVYNAGYFIMYNGKDFR